MARRFALLAGLQLDEAAFPVLLAASLAERKALDGIAIADMVCRALSFLAANGPSTPQDRWEENPGINPFTLTICIAALVAGAEFLPADAKDFALALADFWNSRIEFLDGRRHYAARAAAGSRSYYIRLAPVEVLGDPRSLNSTLYLKNRKSGATRVDEEIGVDFLWLVRFGLRSPDDALIRDTVTVADVLLKVDTPNGLPGIATTATATANTPMGGHSTAPAAAAPGRFSPASAVTTNWSPETIRRGT